ncbi:MAG: glycosyltransferase family 2 protein [Ferruginibacter sp.]|nr:glycosyltransferase family 2 protein [Cytophagales bacterium]
MATVAIVILNYNGRHFLERFLPGVIQFSTGCQVVVADNGSTDSSVAFLHNHFPEVAVIRLGENRGFCKGYNLALQQVEARYYILLNSDVEVTPGWVGPLIKLMEMNPRMGACQPKIKSFDRRHCFEYAGAAGGWLDKWGYPFCRGRIFEVLEEDQGQYDDTAEVFWASGACVCIRSSLYRSLGGLDDGFFAHMEEIDLCWRMKKRGYSVFYCGESEVYHVGGGTLPKSNSRKTFLNFRNGLALLYKNVPRHQLLQVLFVRLLLDGIAGVKFFLEGNPANAWAVVKAHFSFYANFGRWQLKRSQELASTEYETLSGLYSGSIVYAHFIRGKKTFGQIKI